jgi:hypothetical protein
VYGIVKQRGGYITVQTEILEKPFTLEDLVEKVCEILDVQS